MSTEYNEEVLKSLNEQLAELVKEASTALKKAVDFAEKHNLTFYFDPGGHGTYDPNEFGWSDSHC